MMTADLRLVVNTEEEARAVAAALASQLTGPVTLTLRRPSRGRKGGFLMYGTLVVLTPEEQLAQAGRVLDVTQRAAQRYFGPAEEES